MRRSFFYAAVPVFALSLTACTTEPVNASGSSSASSSFVKAHESHSSATDSPSAPSSTSAPADTESYDKADNETATWNEYFYSIESVPDLRLAMIVNDKADSNGHMTEATRNSIRRDIADMCSSTGAWGMDRKEYVKRQTEMSSGGRTNYDMSDAQLKRFSSAAWDVCALPSVLSSVSDDY